MIHFGIRLLQKKERMRSLTESLEVSAPPGRVWDMGVDFEARPQWAPRVKEARIVDGGLLKEGSKIRLKIGRDRFTANVVEIRPPEQLTLLVRGPGFRVNHVYELRPDSENVSLTLTGHYSGLVGSLVARFMSGSIRRDLTDELDAIKRASEAGL